MRVDPWVDMGTCPPNFWSGGTPCVLSPPYFQGDDICVMLNCTTLPCYFRLLPIMYCSLKLLIFTVTGLSDLHCIVHSVTALRWINLPIAHANAIISLHAVYLMNIDITSPDKMWLCSVVHAVITIYDNDVNVMWCSHCAVVLLYRLLYWYNRNRLVAN